ncbi:glycosyl transferase, partial [Staphylococcus haemolyticus]
FISGSFSEGFGLTYIEALNAGLPIVTYKARFGAMELIKEGVNGYLKDFSRNDDTYNVQQLTEGIRQLVATDLNQLKANTRKSVRMFQDTIIAEKWSELIDAL